MTDFDMEMLAVTETKIKEAKDERICSIKDILQIIGGFVALNIHGKDEALEAALDKIRPSDGKFSLQDIMKMRKVLVEISARRQKISKTTEEQLNTVSEYIRLYLANGVPPQELDVSLGDVYESLKGLKIITEELESKLLAIHPQAKLIFKDVHFSQKNNSENLRKAIVNRSKRTREVVLGNISFLDNQPTYAASPEAMKKRTEMINEFLGFLKTVQLYLGE